MPNQSTRIPCTCQVCGTVSHLIPAEVAKGRGKFCSRSCFQVARRLQSLDPATLAARFWSKVDRSGGPDACWLWDHPGGYGYGTFHVGGRQVHAHRVSWELAHGPIPPGLYVCHNCPGGDNRACVNPAHLFLGTYADNMADMYAKGGQARGERVASSSLTEERVRDIRRRYAAGGISQEALAKEHGVCQSIVSRIVRGVGWRHVA